MKIIRHKLVILASLCGMGLLLSLILYANNFIIFGIDIFGLYTLLIPTSGLLVILLMREFEVYRVAKLIIENKIMSIETAEIKEKSNRTDESTMKIYSTEVFISCFGILLGSRVIKFNIDKISLKKVEIGQDLICLVYGNNKTIQKTSLLHGCIDKNELTNIVERFRYETGITPIIVD